MIKRARKKNTKMLTGLLSLFLVCVCVIINGCVPSLVGGDWISDLNDQLNNGEISQEEYDDMFKDYSGGIELEGIKVLRRPSAYSYDANSETSEYYKAFSDDIFNNINYLYGNLSATFDFAPEFPKDETEKTEENKNIFYMLSLVEDHKNLALKSLSDAYKSENKEQFKYFYDALRYQITSVVTKYGYDDNGTIKYVVESELPAGVDKSTLPSYMEVTADLNKGWNWFKSNAAGTEGYTNFKYDYTADGKDYRSYIAYEENYAYYDDENQYEIAVNGSLVTVKFDKDLFNYLDIVEWYRIISDNYASKVTNEDFSYALGYAIYCIVLGLNPNEIGWSNGEFQVSGYQKVVDAENPENNKSSAKVAFEDIKALFEKNGSYVGLTTRDKENIADYILEKVIGTEAQNYGVQQLYYRDVVTAIVDYCGKLTTIGSSTGGSTDVGSNFIASEIIDYPGTSFFVSQDETNEFEYINSFEYQSFVIMPKGETKITDIWLDFQYIARDGAVILDDKNLYIDITVSVNWWTGTEMKVIKETIRVYNNSFDPGEEGSILMFELDDKTDGFGEPVKIGKFECDEIDVEKSGSTDVDEHTQLKKLVLKGATDARFYYQLVQNEEDENGRYGAYGKLDNERISREHPNMSYLEITFDVAKPSGDFSRNYDFYTGFSQFNDAETDYSGFQ